MKTRIESTASLCRSVSEPNPLREQASVHQRRNESLTCTCVWSEMFCELVVHSSENQEALLIPLINHPTDVRVLSCRFQQSGGAAGHQGECFAEDFYGRKRSEARVLCIQSRDAPICVALSPRSAMFAARNDDGAGSRMFYTPVGGDVTLRWPVRRLATYSRWKINTGLIVRRGRLERHCRDRFRVFFQVSI
jgi:hypothetical protein